MSTLDHGIESCFQCLTISRKQNRSKEILGNKNKNNNNNNNNNNRKISWKSHWSQ